MTGFLVEMGKQRNKQMKLKIVGGSANNFKTKDGDLSLERYSIRVKDKIYTFFKSFTKFITKKDVIRRYETGKVWKIEKIS